MFWCQVRILEIISETQHESRKEGGRDKPRHLTGNHDVERVRWNSQRPPSSYHHRSGTGQDGALRKSRA